MKFDSTLFEISWEVCNKIGGIFTVIESKTPYLSEYFQNHYLIGPYVGNSQHFFNEKDIPQDFIEAVTDLEHMGIKVHFGTTNIRGEREVILVEHLGYARNNNEIKKYLWEKHYIDSLNSQWYDFDEAIVWSWCCGIVIEKLTKNYRHKILVQAHEWMSGGAIFYLDSLKDDKYKTIFTTHATMLGRSIAGSGLDMYKLKDKIDPKQFSYEMGVHTKHQTEMALAHISSCFTTVSDITNEEAKLFYHKGADVLLYNGFDNYDIDDVNLLNEKFFIEREKTNDFLKGYFNDFYDIDVDNTKIFFTSGRNEFRNKGYDIYIKALAKLNKRLIDEDSKLQLVNFFVVMVSDFKPRCDVLDSIENYKNNIKEKASDYAPLTTHNIEGHDIKVNLENEELNNHINNKVKNIFVPMDLNSRDGVINRRYLDFICGCDLSVFASYYEPWGYTPIESISFAVPTLTSDLSGFGKTIVHNCGESCPAVEVLKRDKRDDNVVIDELTDFMYKVMHENEKNSLFQREIAKWLDLKYDWSKFKKNYIKAYEFALGK